MQGITLFNLQALERLKTQEEEKQQAQQIQGSPRRFPPVQQQQQQQQDDNDISIMSTSTTPLISNGMPNLALTSSSPAAAAATSSSSTSSFPKNKNQGRLSASVLSAYDLRNRSPPSYVSLTVKNQTVKTGPPAQRHKDRNSFKFAGGKNGDSASNEVCLDMPLTELYPSTVTVRLVYEGQPTKTLAADYKLSSLKMNETTWLILTMEPETPSGQGGVNDSYSIASAEDETLPTLRLQMTLTGPYRTEIAALVNLCQWWFGAIDTAQGSVDKAVSKLPKLPLPDARYLLVPAVPFAAVAVVTAPLLIGILVIGLPVFLPIAALAGSFLAAVVLVAMGIYSSTEQGRSQIGGMLAPVSQTVLSTPSGQTLVYQTGPRPTPVKVARAILPAGIWQRLLVSLLVDLIGSSSYLLPFVGEGADIVWAPVQTILIMAMYDKTSPNLKYVSFVEEILPFTDIVPSATIGWLMQFGLPLVFQQAEENNIDISLVANAVGAVTSKVSSKNGTNKNGGSAIPVLPRKDN